MGSSRSSRSPLKRHHHKNKHKKRGKDRDRRKNGVHGSDRSEEKYRNISINKKNKCRDSINHEFEKDVRETRHSKYRKQTYIANSSSDSQDSEEYCTYSVNKKRKRQKEIETSLDEQINRMKQQEDEERQIIKDETSKRIELLVKKRVEEELIRRKDEIEKEVMRRVEAAKSEMERDLMFELEKQREQIREEARHREEFEKKKREELEDIFAENNRRIEEAQRKLSFVSVANMEQNKEKIWVILQNYYDKGKNASQAANKIYAVYGPDTVFISTAQRWFQRFRSGVEVVEDEPRSGRPAVENCDKIAELVERDRHSSHQTVINHLKKLEITKKLDVWVPHELIQ
ncbi:UPF0430 protein CG31712 isoform X3 [Bactrocera dorsalis]|uniref:UPF0430 protein CG31712 isoform X3 n=1 Tax=Bactrocera dorsalis TaxID=27457 RepID=A0ABM3KAR3_BACDO|nr:UPF0430 protein CG31712 isoform X3 [Bactrocera dorsalis]